MILKSTRIKTVSGAGRVGGHVFDGPENEAIETLAGDRADLDLMVADAERTGVAYAIRHVVMSPAGDMAEGDWQRAADAVLKEFGGEGHPFALIRHTKPRASGVGSEQHAHLMIGEVHPETGKVLSDSHSFARQEKVARTLEFEFGHAITPGKFNRAVAAQLLDEGREDVAEAMRSAILADRPAAAYSTEEFQIAKRSGIDLAGLKAELASALKSGGDPRAVAEQFGARVFMGDRHWMVDVGSPRQKALHRFVKEKAATVAAIMEGQTNDQPTAGNQIGHDRNFGLAGQGRGRTEPLGPDYAGARRDESGHSRPGRQDGPRVADSKGLLSRVIAAKHRGWRPPEKTARDADDLMRRVVAGIKEQGWSGPRTQAWLSGLRKADPQAWVRLNEMRQRGMLGAIIRQPAPRQYLASVRLPRRGGGGGGAPVQEPDARRLPCLSDEDEYAHGRGFYHDPTMRI